MPDSGQASIWEPDEPTSEGDRSALSPSPRDQASKLMQESYATRVNIMRPDALSVKGYAFRRRCTITVGPDMGLSPTLRSHTPISYTILTRLPLLLQNAWYQLTFEHGVSDPSPTAGLTPSG